MRKYLLNHGFVLFVSICTLFLTIQPSNGMALPSESVLALERESAREAQIDKIMSVLDRPEAKAHLVTMGISRAELKNRLSQLDDTQLALVSEKADAVKAAGSHEIVGALIVILLIVFLVVLIFHFAH